jgi:hypothetical protein
MGADGSSEAESVRASGGGLKMATPQLVELAFEEHLRNISKSSGEVVSSLYAIGDEEIWLPASLIQIDVERKLITMPRWLAREKGLIEMSNIARSEVNDITDAFDILAEAVKLMREGKAQDTLLPALEASLDVFQIYVIDHSRAADALERIASAQEEMINQHREMLETQKQSLRLNQTYAKSVGLEQ